MGTVNIPYLDDPVQAYSKSACEVTVTALSEDSESQHDQEPQGRTIKHQCFDLSDVFLLVEYLQLSWLSTLHRFGVDIGPQATQWGLMLRVEHKSTSSIEHEKRYLPPFPADFDSGLSILALREGLSLSKPGKLAIGDIWGRENTASIFFEYGDGKDKWVYQIQATIEAQHFTLDPSWQSGSTTQHDTMAKFNSFASILQSLLQNEVNSMHSVLEVNSMELDQIWEWNAAVPPRIATSMYQYFTKHAFISPDNPAIHSWDGNLTYGELRDRSRILAHRLTEVGVGKGWIVPLCFEKSMWTTVALLAVMKTGACFTLMDPSQPLARLRTIVEQTEARIILTSDLHQDLGCRLSDNATVMSISDKTFLQSEFSTTEDWTCRSTDLDAPMYIQFTSGSTGKPKGVVISFASYTSGAVPRATKVGYHAGSRCLDFPSYAFDVSIDCILCTLSTGGCVCVPSEDDRLNNIAGAIKKLNAKMVHVTPSVARLLSPDTLQSIEVLGLGGEYVSPDDIRSWSSTCQLAIAYGPSECTVGCTINDEVSPTCAGIGRGVGGVTWIVNPDDHDKLSPVGAAGELLIEGPIVGDGYLGQPDKTAELFIESPSWLLAGHGNVPGRSSRLYKTGDLVRYDVQTGTINFIGRKDQQVKLRGQRVELGEVEHGLKTSLPPTFAAVADVLRLGGKGEPVLVAFLANLDAVHPNVNQDIELLTLKAETQMVFHDAEQEMAQLVPRFMIPSAWILLNHLPMLVSGKIDRKKLREVGSGVSVRQLQQLKSKSKAPTSIENAAEQKLFLAWKKVLGDVMDLNRNDNFFHAGGDSLKAMHLVAAARAMGLSLTVADVFNHPTLAEMTSVIKPFEAQQDADIPCFSLVKQQPVNDIRLSAAKQCGIPPDAVEDLYPCTPLQEGVMALSAKFSNAYIAQRVVNVPDKQTAIALHRAFEVAANDAAIMRTRIVQVPSAGLLQVVVKSQSDLRLKTHNDLQEYLSNDQKDVMGLGTPLVRYAIVDSSKTNGVHFVLTIHHALYDGWCMPLIVERVNNAFHGRSLSKVTPFKSFIKFLANLNRMECDTFWMEYLRGTSQPQFPRLPSRNYQTKADSLLERYIALPSYPADHTVATLIRATWALVASKFIASDDIVFGETLTGRNAAIVGAEEIEGPMITTVPVRVRINRSLRVSQYLDFVHNLAIQRMPYEHAGLQNVRRLSSDAREACELRTGLVLHPRVDESAASTSSGPADAFIPANEAEAAREALHFNTYALMLVCTVHSDGFLIMASFDSNCVGLSTMNRVLEEFDNVITQFCNLADPSLSTFRYLDSATLESAPSTPRTPQEMTGSISPVSPFIETKDLLTPDTAFSPMSTISRGGPPNAKQEILSQIWCRILGVEASDLHPDSDFFDFGDSISAMKLVSEARMEGLQLSVAQIFNHRELSKIAEISEWIEKPKTELAIARKNYSRFSALNDSLTASLILAAIKPHLADQSWKLEDIYPARPLQAIAVDGTIRLPRYSVRYEAIYFNHYLDQERLQRAVQTLVDMNEILRTIFIKIDTRTLGVVLSQLQVICQLQTVDADLKTYVQSFCTLDVLRVQPLGSPFVAFHYIQGSDNRSCLVFKISHAQYDENCLPIMLNQLSALYEDRPITPSGAPFSTFVKHVIQENIEQSVPYWRNLLQGSRMTILKPDIPLTSRKAVSIFKTFDISARSKSVTVATLPTAAWALCLAKTLAIQDVVFGEVVSGRNTGLPNCDSINGPCWQYIPVRVQLREGMTFLELLQFVQAQHVASSRFEGIGLEEIRKECTGWPESIDWFGSVVHQDVEHVTALPFESASTEMETLYPHLENLREVKCQCFLSGQSMTIEIVTYESWKSFGADLMETFGGVLTDLISSPHATFQV